MHDLPVSDWDDNRHVKPAPSSTFKPSCSTPTVEIVRSPELQSSYNYAGTAPAISSAVTPVESNKKRRAEMKSGISPSSVVGNTNAIMATTQQITPTMNLDAVEASTNPEPEADFDAFFSRMDAKLPALLTKHAALAVQMANTVRWIKRIDPTWNPAPKHPRLDYAIRDVLTSSKLGLTIEQIVEKLPNEFDGIEFSEVDEMVDTDTARAKPFFAKGADGLISLRKKGK